MQRRDRTLFTAINNHDLSTIKQMVERFGKRILDTELNLQTTAVAAAEAGNTEFLQYLYELGFYDLLTLTDSTGSTPAFAAGKHGHINTLRWLIEHVPESYRILEETDHLERTLVHWAASRDDDEMLIFLADLLGPRLFGRSDRFGSLPTEFTNNEDTINLINLLQNNPSLTREAIEFSEAREIIHDHPDLPVDSLISLMLGVISAHTNMIEVRKR